MLDRRGDVRFLESKIIGCYFGTLNTIKELDNCRLWIGDS